MSRARAATIAGAFLVAAGCAVTASQPFILAGATPPLRVAVLPFANDSNSLDAPEFLAALVALRLGAAGYRLVPPADVAQRLQWAGITQGGQIDSLGPAALAELLGADGLYYGTVTRFKYITLGVYQDREVGLSGVLKRPDGTMLWRHVAMVASKEVNPAAAKNLRTMLEAAAMQLGVKLLEKWLAHPLLAESQACVRDLLSRIPAGALRSRAPMEWYIP